MAKKIFCDICDVPLDVRFNKMLVTYDPVTGRFEAGERADGAIHQITVEHYICDGETETAELCAECIARIYSAASLAVLEGLFPTKKGATI